MLNFGASKKPGCIGEDPCFRAYTIFMKRIIFDFNVSERYEYFVTKNGEVFKVDVRNGKTSECYYHIAHGYKRIRVTDIDTNTRRYLRVSRLVAIYFVENPNPEKYDIVNHKDGNKLNNNYENLEWCDISKNTQHAYNNDLIHDRGGWKGTPYSERIKNKENTESSNI